MSAMLDLPDVPVVSSMPVSRLGFCALVCGVSSLHNFTSTCRDTVESWELDVLSMDGDAQTKAWLTTGLIRAWITIQHTAEPLARWPSTFSLIRLWVEQLADIGQRSPAVHGILLRGCHALMCFSIQAATFKRFHSVVKAGYNDLPYHNYAHACDAAWQAVGSFSISICMLCTCTYIYRCREKACRL